MGMFDAVHFEMACPKCNNLITGFQSKDLCCLDDTVEPDAVDNFYSSCGKCLLWFKFHRERPKGNRLREKSLTLDEVLTLGFKLEVHQI
jgi:hypothetical protein